MIWMIREDGVERIENAVCHAWAIVVLDIELIFFKKQRRTSQEHNRYSPGTN
jgi:hypothetical protein